MAFAALDDLVPLYPVYALLFADTGLSGGQIGTLLVIWSFVSMVAEVPSGALADRISRRQLLMASGAIRGAGFALWVLLPSYPAFAVGFVLWGIGSSLTSGTLEALIYDTLTELGAVDRYGSIRARVGAAQLLAELTASLAAVPLIAIGGYHLLGAVTVVTCLMQIAVAATLPRSRSTDDDDDSGYLDTLRSGVVEAATHRVVRRLVILAALLACIHGVDEYIPLLLRSAGASDPMVALLVGAFPLAAAAGAASAARVAGVRSIVPAAGLILGALAVALTATSGPLVGTVALATWYGLVQLARVIADIRLQDAISGPARATVTSVAGLGEEVCTIGVFAGYGLALDAVAPSTLLRSGVTVPTLALAVLVIWWLAAVRSHRPG